MSSRFTWMAFGLGLLVTVAPASAQIIATSLPREGATTAAGGEKRFAFHLMAAPFAKWKYGEIYLDPTDVFGTIQGRPNSDYMVAAEAVLGKANGFNLSVGGWYNKIGTNSFDFVGFGANTGRFLDAQLTTEDFIIYEGHVGIFYKSIGVQGGIVRTTGRLPGGTVTLEGNRPANRPFTLNVPDVDTTDYDAFAIYRLQLGQSTPVSFSLGAGVYRKAGVLGNPLRLEDTQTVPTAFIAASVGVFKGFGIDASFWYVGQTDATKDGGLEGIGIFAPRDFASDSQTRLTVGLGYTF